MQLFLRKRIRTFQCVVCQFIRFWNYSSFKISYPVCVKACSFYLCRLWLILLIKSKQPILQTLPPSNPLLPLLLPLHHHTMIAFRTFLVICIITMLVGISDAQKLRAVPQHVAVTTETDSTGLFTCPADAPQVGTYCDIDAVRSVDSCSYNPVHVPGIAEQVPSVACICTIDGLWSCSISPEYLQSLRQVTSS